MRILCLPLVLATLALVSAAAPTSPERSDVPLFRGPSLPDPPRQNQPWTPPATTLPRNVVTAAQFLFDLGLADPRGCEYSEFEVAVGNIWGHASAFKAHGWVFESAANPAQSFAVSWAGTVYPLVRPGAQAELAQDLEAALKDTSMDPSRRRYGVPAESASISESRASLTKIALLLRLGETELAERCWAAWGSLSSGPAPDLELDRTDPFRSLAYEWTWALFNRAVCAHMRSDDVLALADCRRLAQAWPKLEAEATRRGFQQNRYSQSGRENELRPHLDFLEPLPALLADQERRATKAAPAPAQPGTQATPPANRPSIDSLIAGLDEVQERQWSQPGGVSLVHSPTVQALIQYGDAAVEPLLQCMETDERLTRSVSFHRDFFPTRRILSVSDAARAALDEILKVRFETRAEYRVYWERFKGLSRVERWHATLRDDRQKPDQWLQAARSIVSRTDGQHIYTWPNAAPAAGSNALAFAGEALRKAEPSVTELLLRRALEIAPTNFQSSMDCWTFQNAADLGLMLAEWEPSAARALRQIIARCPALNFDAPGRWSSGCGIVLVKLAALAEALAEAGDTTGLDSYAGWIERQTLTDVRDALPSVLAPLARFPDHFSIKRASRRLFSNNQAEWLDISGGSDLLQTRLVANPSFRTLILEGLKNIASEGTIIVKASGEYSVQTRAGSEGGQLTPDSFAPAPDQPVRFRINDYLAYRLSRNLAVSFQLYWPEARRDEAISAVTAALRESTFQFRESRAR